MDVFETMKYIRRITVDLDTREIKPLLRCLRVLRHHGFVKELTVHNSPSGKGFHVSAWAKKGVPLNKLLKIRRKAGDDAIRIMLDSKANRMINVLFTNKTKNKTDLILDGIPLEYEVIGSEENTKISYGEV